MTKSELIMKIQERFPDIERKIVEDAVFLFFNEIANALQKRHRVEIRGFGSFCVRKRHKRLSRNPRTGETVKVEEKYTPFFKAGKAFRELLNTSASPSSFKDISYSQDAIGGQNSLHMIRS